MNRFFARAALTLSVCSLTACAPLIPPGIPSGMTSPSARGTPISSFPEHFVYRIDDHRYITIQGNSGCEGMIWYYDTRLGVHTAVAATGLTLGDGAFGGYYAVSSEYVAIPAIVFSQTNGELLYIYYSHDGGRTFKRFLWGANIANRGVVVLDGKHLYVGRRSSDPQTGLYLANVYDVSHDIPIGDDQQAVNPEGRWIDPRQVPMTVTSPSGSTTWSCEASAGSR